MTRHALLHHAEGEPTVPDDLYDDIFEQGRLGDWYWASVEWDGVQHECLHILVPSLREEGQGRLEARGLELIEIYPVHAQDNWARPGTVNGWDGNRDHPTLTPSIFVGGRSAEPGWHGFFEAGKLRNA